MRQVSIVRTGVANLASVRASFERLGMEPVLVETPREVDEARRVVLPGVGAFGSAMDVLEDLRLVEPLRRRFEGGAPTLAICLGLQLAANGSQEAPGRAGLGVVPAEAVRFPASVRVPQLGWNRICADPGACLVEDGYAVFANSYALAVPPEGERLGDWSVARSIHGLPFVAALERGAQLLCQFHPELSGTFGARVLERWLQASGVTTGGVAC